MSKMWVRDIAYFVNVVIYRHVHIHNRARAASYLGSLDDGSLSFYKLKLTSEQSKKARLSLVHLRSKMWVREFA